MHITLVSLFPDMLDAVTEYGVTGRATREGILTVDAVNPRDFTQDRHRTVDDRPFGGGPGMVMKVEPLAGAIEQAKAALPKAKVVYLSPQGRTLDQQGVARFAQQDELILVAGRYEGIDERLLEHHIDECCSIGDYILSGGELPALVLIDAVARCLPGVLGHEASAQQDSFSGEMTWLLDHPHYTRPEEIDGNEKQLAVPPVLLSGHHDRIARWRKQQSLGRTWLYRPDLLKKRRELIGLDDEEEALLAEFIRQQHEKDS